MILRYSSAAFSDVHSLSVMQRYPCFSAGVFKGGDDEGDEGSDEGDEGSDEGDEGSDEGDEGSDEGGDGRTRWGSRMTPAARK